MKRMHDYNSRLYIPISRFSWIKWTYYITHHATYSLLCYWTNRKARFATQVLTIRIYRTIFHQYMVSRNLNKLINYFFFLINLFLKSRFSAFLSIPAAKFKYVILLKVCCSCSCYAVEQSVIHNNENKLSRISYINLFSRDSQFSLLKKKVCVW